MVVCTCALSTAVDKYRIRLGAFTWLQNETWRTPIILCRHINISMQSQERMPKKQLHHTGVQGHWNADLCWAEENCSEQGIVVLSRGWGNIVKHKLYNPYMSGFETPAGCMNFYNLYKTILFTTPYC